MHTKTKMFPVFSVILSVLLLFGQTAVYAQNNDDYLPEIVDVEVRGNVVVSSQVILNKIKSREGQTLSREVINQDIKRLYSTGYFKDVKVDLVPEGKDYRIVYIVDEKPVISKIIITGAHHFKMHTLMSEIGLREGQVLDRKLLKDGIHNIELRYKKKGYRFVSIKDNVAVDELRKEVVITITIDEGQRFRIESIDFTGNTHFTSRELRRKMSTKVHNLIRSGAFDEFKFQDDIERLTALYQREGFLDVSFSPSVNYDNANNAIHIEIAVNEGMQYHTGTVSFEGNAQFPKMEIWERITMLPGSVFSPAGMHDDVNNIKKYYFEKGHIDAQVTPQMNYHKEKGTVDVTYQIQEGSVFYIDKIRIRGNTKTKDIVIRRELRVYPGEKFDGKKLEVSKQRLEDLGYFEDVEYETEPGSDPTKRDLVFKVKERQTGEFSFGGGFSSVENYLGFVELSQNNFDFMNWPTFTGAGQKMSIKGRWGQISRDVDVSFLEPYLFDKPYSFGIHAYRWSEDIDALDYSTTRMGVSFTLGKDFTDYLHASLSYNFENVKMNDIESGAYRDVLLTNSDAWLSKLKASLSYDRRNSKVYPTKGYIASLAGEMVGGVLGGDEDYYDFEFRFNQYWTFFEKHVLQFKSQLGVMNEYGDSSFVPVYDRFYAGGLGSIRGYRYHRVGPKGNGSPIGGDTLALFSLEYTFPIIENFKGALFIDTAHVNYDSFDINFSQFAVSVGPGLMINTPIGPIALYYGYPIKNADSKDKNGRFEFSFSRGF